MDKHSQRTLAMHLLVLEDEGKHLFVGQVHTTKPEHHNRERAISHNAMSSGDFITTYRNISAQIDTDAQSCRG